MQVLVGQAGYAAAAGGAGQHAHLHQVRLADILQRDALLAQGGGQRFQADRAAVVHFDNSAQQAAVQLVQAQLVNVHPLAGRDGGLLIDGAVTLHRSKVAGALEHAVGDTRRTTGTAGQFQRALISDGHTQNACTAGDDAPQLLGAVQLQLEQNAEAVTQRACQLPGAGGSTHQRELGQVDADALGAGAFADHDIQREIFQCRVKHFLHLTGQAVDLIDKEDVALLQVGQQCRQVAGLLDGRAGGNADLYAHFLRHNASQRGFAQAGRAVEQDVVHRLTALLRRPQIDF